jgi:hypothetical protein
MGIAAIPGFSVDANRSAFFRMAAIRLVLIFIDTFPALNIFCFPVDSYIFLSMMPDIASVEQFVG